MEHVFLNPQTTIFEQAPNGTLRATVPDNRCALNIEAMRAFPLSHPDEHIVLRDGKVEIGIIERLVDVPEPAQTWLREQLRRRYFLPRIGAIHNIFERFGTSVWDIDTDRGRRTVTTGAMNEAVFEIEPGRYLITDLEGNRYELTDLSKLDGASRERFMGKV